MERMPASAGWLWVKEGFALFRKQPIEMSTLFLAYLFLMFAIGILPVLGQILPIMLVPVFSMAFLQACVHIEQGKKVYPNLLLTGFRSPGVKRLLILGGFYFAAALAAIAASALVDGGNFWNIMVGRQPLDVEAARGANMSLAMMVAALVYTPAAMAFWYAAPLIAWQDMGIGKSLFYSFFAVRRSGRAFIVYGLSWLLIGVLLPAIVSSLIAMLFGGPAFMMLFLLSVSMVMTVVMYCSFYPTYAHVFGAPHRTTLPKE